MNPTQNTCIDGLSGWWSALELPAQILYVIGGIALVVVIVQAVLTLVGGDADADMPETADALHDAGLGLISVRTLTAFFMGFGLCGGLLLEAGKPLPWAIAGALGVGLIFLFIIFAIMKMLYKMRSSGNINLNTATHSTGTVYVKIPANGVAGGQIELQVSGRVMTFPAITHGEDALPAGTLVRVVETLPNNIFVVEKN